MRAVTVRKLIDRARSRLPKQLRREPANNIGAYFAQGEEGLPKNLRKALYWYTLGAIDGDFVAQCNLALMHYYGEGDVERNRWLAYKWFIPAAAQGDGQAMTYLGQMRVNGEIVEKDEDAAARWFRRAKRDGWSIHEWENWLIQYDV